MTNLSGFLSPEDLRRMTGRVRANGQEEWLKVEGIPHKRQGSDMLVMWVHVQAWIEGRFTPPKPEPQLRLTGGGDGRTREARAAKRQREEAEVDRILATTIRTGRSPAD